MEGLWIVIMIATVLIVTPLATKLGVASPLALVVVGIAASFVPFIPHEVLDPHLVLSGLLPPLLYASAIRVSLLDFRSEARVIVRLSVGLLVFTAFGVGLVAWWVLPIGFAAAFALGAVVAPPDAVAATAVGRSIGLPRRVVTMLEGESLLNDATALVLLSTAIAAMDHGTTPLAVGGGFVLSAVGGTVVGIVVAKVVGFAHQRIQSPSWSTGLSLLTPWLAWFPAEAIHSSGVLAVVVAGLLIAHASPTQQDAVSRLGERINWRTVQFLLENVVFLIIGLQMSTVLTNVSRSNLSLGTIVLACTAVFAAVLALRFLWVFAHRWFARMRRAGGVGQLSVGESAVLAFAGMRGVVTLAAAFILPPETPQRDVLVLCAMVVTIGTLILQGSTLPLFARWAGVRGPGAREDALQEAHAVQQVVTAGMAKIDEIAELHTLDPDLVEELRSLGRRRINRAWEALAHPDDTTPARTFQALRLKMLRAERVEALRIRRERGVDFEVLQRVMDSLDLVESMVIQSLERPYDDAEIVDTPATLTNECAELTVAARQDEPAASGATCAQCEAEGTQPVQLRKCLNCGHVGCCDSSVGQHSRRHWEASGHAVMASAQPGENWRWCFRHEQLG